MIKLIFVEADGTEHVVRATLGQSVMEAAIWNNVPGIDAVCGGAMACSTCLVHLAQEWRDQLPAPSSEETDLISTHAHGTTDSRLSCQLRISATFDGIVLKLPPAQQ